LPNEAAHIAIVDDDPKVRLLLRRCFEPEGYRVSEAADGKGLLDLVRAGGLDLVTLDLGLGGEDGLDVARRVRAASAVPIVMITGKGDVIDRIVGLELGADDYITKPFHVREVLARVRSVLRRAVEARAVSPHPVSPEPACERFAFGPWVLDIGSRELRSREGRACELTTAEFELLCVFVRKPNRVLSRDALMSALKGDDWAAFDRSIDSQVARLRKKIESEPNAPRLIKTVRGAGYTLAAEVRPV